MNIKQIAKECGFINEHNGVTLDLTQGRILNRLTAFAKALIGDSEPVAWAEVIDGGIIPDKNHEPNVAWTECAEYKTPLFTKPPSNKDAECERLKNKLNEAVEIINDMKPSYGDIGSRDVDVADARKRIENFIEALKG